MILDPTNLLTGGRVLSCVDAQRQHATVNADLEQQLRVSDRRTAVPCPQCKAHFCLGSLSHTPLQLT